MKENIHEHIYGYLAQLECEFERVKKVFDKVKNEKKKAERDHDEATRSYTDLIQLELKLKKDIYKLEKWI